MLPMMVPHILINLSLLLLPRAFRCRARRAEVGHVSHFCLPFTITGIVASLEGVDARQARGYTLGASYSICQ